MTLRFALLSIWRYAMARKIVITSGKGGVGKTTVCANLGTQLASGGAKVVMLDADVGLNNLDVLMGLENKVTYDIYDVIQGKCRIQQALIHDVNYPSLSVLPSLRGGSYSKIGAAEIRSVVDRLGKYDFVLIDCPAGIESGFHRAVSSASEALVVVNPTVSSLRDADKVITLLSTYNLSSINLVVNRVRGDMVIRGECMSPVDISRLLKTHIGGVIPESEYIAMSYGAKLLGSDEERYAFSLLADNVVNGRHRIYDYTAPYKGILGKLKLLRRRY